MFEHSPLKGLLLSTAFAVSSLRVEICGIFINCEQLQEIIHISLGVLTPTSVDLLSDQLRQILKI